VKVEFSVEVEFSLLCEVVGVMVMMGGKDLLIYRLKSCGEIRNPAFLVSDKFHTNIASHSICSVSFRLEMFACHRRFCKQP